MKTNKIKSVLIIMMLLFIFGLGAQAATTTTILPVATGDYPDTEQCRSSIDHCGAYTLNDFVMLGINVSKFILGIVGSLSLLMFIYGGFRFLISMGSSEGVKKGKDTIVYAVVGLIIVFSSYLIIKFAMSAMGLNWDGTVSPPKAL